MITNLTFSLHFYWALKAVLREVVPQTCSFPILDISNSPPLAPLLSGWPVHSGVHSFVSTQMSWHISFSPRNMHSFCSIRLTPLAALRTSFFPCTLELFWHDQPTLLHSITMPPLLPSGDRPWFRWNMLQTSLGTFQSLHTLVPCIYHYLSVQIFYPCHILSTCHANSIFALICIKGKKSEKRGDYFSFTLPFCQASY